VRVHPLVDDGNCCGEAPLWDVEQQRLYWTDITGRNFYSYDWSSRRRHVILQGFEVSGCALDSSGALIFVNGTGIWWWDQIKPPKRTLDRCGGDILQLNDCVADPVGRLLTGSTFYSPASEYALGKLYSIETGETIRVLDEGFHLANGLAFSVDGCKLYAADSIARVIYVYEYDSKSGEASKRRVFVKLEKDSGLPDGLTVDSEDCVWSAEWYGSCIRRYDPDGVLERTIQIPAKQCSSLAFGGSELRDLFVTSAATSEPMPEMPPGYDSEAGYFGGALFHLVPGVQGREEYRTRFSADYGGKESE
jgi:sugar lactone lactonase YvrE